VAELQRHFVEGRLSADELSERVDHALAARTFGDLEMLLEDLPAEERQPPRPQPRAWWTAFTTMPGLLLLAMLAILIGTWLFWLPNGGTVAWPVLILGGVFFIGRAPRRFSGRD
jgi:Domain of unknown function (DUF1707)